MASQYIDFVNGSDTALSTVSISGATKANPCVITSNAHGMGNGQWVKITGVVGMTQLNNLVFRINNVTTNTFELQTTAGVNVDSSAYGTWTSGGTVTQWRKTSINSITQANPAVVTAKKHGLSNGNLVIIEDCAGMTQVNNVCFTVANATTDTFELSGIDSSAYGTYTANTGTVVRPYLTMNTLEALRGTVTNPKSFFFEDGDTVKIARTFTYAAITTGSGDIVFTKGSTSVTTSVDLTGSLAVGNYIGLTTATLDGCSDPTISIPNLYYRIDAITSSLITINSKYCGTTITVSSVNRLRSGTEIVSTGAITGDTISTAGTGVTYEGGYSFNTAGAISRSSSVGATAIKQAGTQDAYIIVPTGTNNTFRYINTLGNNRGWSIGGTGNIFEYISSFPVSYYPFLIGGTNPTLNYVTAIGNLNSYSSFQGNSQTNAILNYCFGTGSKSISNFSTTNGTVTFNYCVSEQNNGFTFGSNVGNANNCIARNATATSAYGFYAHNSIKLTNCSADTCYYGVTCPDQSTSQYIYGGTFSNCTVYGIYAYRIDGMYIENVTFSGNVVDIYQESYSRELYVINCTSTTPTNYMIGRALNGGIVHVLGCSIDAPSIAKAYQVVAGARYTNQEYNFQNSFNLTGQYWANGYLLEDTTNYRTSSPSIKLAYNSTIAFMKRPMKIASNYVTGGVRKTITYYIKRDSGSWSGTITPQLRLNGKLIVTGTNITSLNNDWNTSYTISATAGEITEDGELSLEFIYNANNVAIWIDDITVS